MSGILHLTHSEKFIPPFIDFVNKHFGSERHRFLFMDKPGYDYGLTPSHNIEWIDKKSKIFSLLYAMYTADKIILHGLWNKRVIQLLFLQPWLLSKCYWVMWGGDFYFPEKQPWIKKQVIKRIGHLITYIKGDIEIVRRFYHASGIAHESFMYPSNLFQEFADFRPRTETKVIQIGNSADPTNNHAEIFQKLLPYKDENIRIIVPLSYGDIEYREHILKTGVDLFDDKLIPIVNFLPHDQYLELLSNIDIAFFPHNRQQAMGNAITLLGLGKKVYMKSSTTQYHMFKEIGIKVFDIENFELSHINEKDQWQNSQNIKLFFSAQNLKIQLQNIFE